MNKQSYITICFSLLAFASTLSAQVIVEQGSSKQIHFDASGKLVYQKDRLGNRLPDFSYVGYHSGEKAIPYVPVKIILEPKPNDNTEQIQNALDNLGKLTPDENGIRGALLLKKGVYKVSGEILISHSGIVLKGEGNHNEGTVIVAAGYDDDKYKRTLISVGDNTASVNLIETSKQAIVDEFVPIGGNAFDVESASGYKPGDKIIVYRPSTEDWISSIGGDKIEPRWREIEDIQWIKNGKFPGFYYKHVGHDKDTIFKKNNENWEEFVNRIPISKDGKKLNTTRQWEAGGYDFYFERKITKIEGNRIYIDVPLVHTMEKNYGGGFIYHYNTRTLISEVGIENLRLVSEFATPTYDHPYGNSDQKEISEKHAWQGIHIKKNTENIWIRNITGNYFGFSLVSASGTHATIQDCLNLGHASKITGGRRYSFMIEGQFNLVQRCIAFEGRHEFVTQKKTAGPNVFVDCIGYNSKNNSGPHHRYSVGTLFDNVKSEKPMESRYRGNSGSGHGWAGTQTCFYNCIAPEFKVDSPPGGMSWVIGSGQENEKGIRIEPASLYYQQVRDRLGKAGLDRVVNKKQLNNLGEYLWAKNRLDNEKTNIYN